MTNTRLITLKNLIKSGKYSKASQEALLKEVRILEKQLGIESHSYNSNDF